MAERIPLTKAVELLLEECRMVLPGIQALFASSSSPSSATRSSTG